MDNLSRSIIHTNHTVLNQVKTYIRNEKSVDEKLALIQYAVTWALSQPTGTFSDLELEKELLTIAESLPTEPCDFQPNTFLHVMTEAYAVGGHTKIVEKWVDAALVGEKHSLLMIRQNVPMPTSLSQCIDQHGGDIYTLKSTMSPLEKAKELRSIASSHEFIILHIHMDDIVPLLAFGTVKFKRPVIFVNHADHLFWLGASIADHIYELSEDGAKLTRSRRVKAPYTIIPIPIDHKVQSLTREEALNALDRPIPIHTKVILSIGAPYKYEAFKELDFIQMALDLVNQDENILFIVIGPDKDHNERWKKAFDDSHQRVDAIGFKSREEVGLYSAIADLYIESFPFKSYTAFLEVASNGTPALSLDTGLNSLDIVKASPNQCESIQEMIHKATAILNNGAKGYDLSEAIIAQHTLDGLWGKKIRELLRNTSKEHHINTNFSSSTELDIHDERFIIAPPLKDMPIPRDMRLSSALKITAIIYRTGKLSGRPMLTFTRRVIKHHLKKNLKKLLLMPKM